MGCHFLLQGIFLTQGSNLCLLLCRWILYHWVTWEAQRKDYCEPKILIFPLAFPFLICPGNRFGGDVVTFHNLADFPNPQMDQPPQCLNLTVYKMSPHHLLASAMLGTLLVNWKNLLLTAHAVWWPVHTLLSSTVRPFKDTSILHLKAKQVSWTYYGSGLANWGQTNRVSAFCWRFITSVGKREPVSICHIINTVWNYTEPSLVSCGSFGRRGEERLSVRVYVVRSCLIWSQRFLSPVVIALEILYLLWNVVPLLGCTAVLVSFLLRIFVAQLAGVPLNLNVLDSQNFSFFFESSLPLLKKQKELECNWSESLCAFWKEQ